MTFWNNLMLVALGGAVGASGRHLVSLGMARLMGTGWPWGTFTVNVVGGLAMGALVAVLARYGAADGTNWRLLLGTGVLGGFTTFSAFSLETAMMIENNALLGAAGYAMASVVACVLAVFIGMAAIRALA